MRSAAAAVTTSEIVADDPHCVLAGAPDDDAAQLVDVEHAAEQGRPIEHRAFARELEPPRARIGADLAREPRHAGQPLELLDAELGEVGGSRVLDARVGVARERDVDGAQIAARREREPRLEQARLRQRREERRQIFEPQEAAAQREMLDAVRVAPDVDVDGGRFGPGAARARDGDVAQREPPGIARALPIARQRDALEARIDGAERALQRHVGEREVGRAAHEHALLPLEPHGHVAAAGLRRHRATAGTTRAATARSTASRSADTRQSPVNSRAGIGVGGDERLRRELDVLGELRAAGSALASSVNTSSSRRRLPATSWKSQATLRAASRYSTRLLRTSTSMSGGTSHRSLLARRLAGAPCKR